MSEFPRFRPKQFTQFQKVLHKRVNDFIEDRKLKPTVSAHLVVKAVVMFAAYLVPYSFLLAFQMPFYFALPLWALMGLGMAGIGMNVMHDGLHGSWSKKGWLNRVMGDSIYLLCGNPFTWKVQHNYLHHTFTNIKGLDEDVEVKGLMRLHREDEWKPIHRHQHLYGPILYSLLTLNWAVTKDFTQMHRYWKKGLLDRFGTDLNLQMTKLIIGKVIYFGLFLAIPLIFSPQSWYISLIGWILMHLVGGFVLSAVFQLAHVVEDAEQFGWEGEDIETNWMEHQLRTTCNFSMKKSWITWLTGGLNYQIEHHLFPYISHAHYPAISDIVRKTALEFGLPYYGEEGMWKALGNHFRTLRSLGAAA